MPALRKPESADYRELPPRQALRAGQADVLVVGGGPAGLGAALGARWAGAHVILAERYGFLGGNATAALVMPLMSFHTQRSVPEQTGDTSLLPQDHGTGNVCHCRCAAGVPRQAEPGWRRHTSLACHGLCRTV